MKPIKIICDSREQKPFSFKFYPEIIVERAGLKTGDYTLDGFRDRVALERKELNDLISCLMPPNRARFERELCRAQSLEFFGVLIEGSMADVWDHRYTSRMTPRAVFQSLAAFSVRYHAAFIWCGNRHTAEYTAYSLLQKYAREIEKRTGRAEESAKAKK